MNKRNLPSCKTCELRTTCPTEYHYPMCYVKQDTDNAVTTVSKTNNAEGNPPPPRKGEMNRPTQRPEGRDTTSGTLQTPNLQTPKPTTTTTTTKKQKTKPYLQTPIKPCSTQETAERLQTMTPNKKHHKTKRGTHIKIGKLTINQNQTTTKPTIKTTLKGFKNQPAILKRPTLLRKTRQPNQLLQRNRLNTRTRITTNLNKQTNFNHQIRPHTPTHRDTQNQHIKLLENQKSIRPHGERLNTTPPYHYGRETKMENKNTKCFTMPIIDKIPEKGKEATIIDYCLFKGKPTIPQMLKQIPKGKTAKIIEIQPINQRK